MVQRPAPHSALAAFGTASHRLRGRIPSITPGSRRDPPDQTSCDRSSDSAHRDKAGCPHSGTPFAGQKHGRPFGLDRAASGRDGDPTLCQGRCWSLRGPPSRLAPESATTRYGTPGLRPARPTLPLSGLRPTTLTESPPLSKAAGEGGSDTSGQARWEVDMTASP